MVLFLSGCSGLLSDTSSTPNQTIAGTTPTLQSEQPKTDSHGIPTEALTRAQLEKVQHIIAGMTLDQKLGQLIIVEYLGNNYEGGLQYMISQQFVGGYMYQESNSNFDPPYNVVSQVDALS